MGFCKARDRFEKGLRLHFWEGFFKLTGKTKKRITIRTLLRTKHGLFY